MKRKETLAITLGLIIALSAHLMAYAIVHEDQDNDNTVVIEETQVPIIINTPYRIIIEPDS